MEISSQEISEIISFFRSQLEIRRFSGETLGILESILVAKCVPSLLQLRLALRQLLQSQVMPAIEEISGKSTDHKLLVADFFVNAFALVGDVESCLALRYEALVLREVNYLRDRGLQVSYEEWLNFARDSLDNGFYANALKGFENAALCFQSEKDVSEPFSKIREKDVLNEIQKLKDTATALLAPNSGKVSQIPKKKTYTSASKLQFVLSQPKYSCKLDVQIRDKKEKHEKTALEQKFTGGHLTIPIKSVDQFQDEVAPPFAVAKGARRRNSSSRGQECDIFDGEWVYDEAARPLYAEEECPYIQPQLTCKAHGRPDSGYQHWRWQPRHCSLPSFNATIMLEMLRGKRMMFVGDSLNRGQFVSLVCLLHRALPDPHMKSMDSFHSDSLTVFTAKSYNATVEFYWAPFLVESNSDDSVVHRITDRIVRVASINQHARHWRGADILVFNTYLWWMAALHIKTLRGPFGGDHMNITEMKTEEAYRIALRRALQWVEKNTDPNKSRVFFVSISPSHHRSEEWGGEMGGNCYNETSPIEDPTYWSPGTSKTMMRVASEVMGGGAGAGFPVTFLNITQLSEYRKDAHTQIYKKQWNPLTAEQIANPRSYADCIHWCLPGLQDTWNELLYTKLFFPSLMATPTSI